MDEKLLPLLVFSTTLALSLLLAFSFKNLLVKIFCCAANKLTRLITTSVEIECSEGMESNVTTWLKLLIEHNCSAKLCHFKITNDIIQYKFRQLLHMYNCNGTSQMNDEEDEEKADASGITKQLEPLQTNQSVFLFYKRTCIRIRRYVNQDHHNQKVKIENFEITAYLTRNKEILVEMLEDGRKMMERKESSKHVNYYKARHQMGHSVWQLVKRIQPRTLSSIILKEGVMNAIQKDLTEFIESKKWYKERGIPYRRGYLLYGPPGMSNSLISDI